MRSWRTQGRVFPELPAFPIELPTSRGWRMVTAGVSLIGVGFAIFGVLFAVGALGPVTTAERVLGALCVAFRVVCVVAMYGNRLTLRADRLEERSFCRLLKVGARVTIEHYSGALRVPFRRMATAQRR